jgi:hypothetical protein
MTAAGSFTFAPTVRVIHRIHGNAAVMRHLPISACAHGYPG